MHDRNLPESVHSMHEMNLPASIDSMHESNLPSSIDGMHEILLLQQKIVLQVLDRLKLCSHRCEYTPQRPLVDIRRVIQHLAQAVRKLFHLTLRRELKSALCPLQDQGARTLESLNFLVDLGNKQCSDLYAVLSELRTVERLVNLCRTSATRQVILLSLRSISSISCTVESIRQLEEAGGIHLLASLLISAASLEVRVEAAGVLAQITSPWISDNHHVEGLEEHLAQLVGQLTTLSRLQCGEDSFLLISAALANLSFMEPASMQYMLVHSTSRILLRRLKEAPTTSIFTRDQVVTVAANLAATKEGRERILETGGVELLVDQLSSRLEDLEDPAEVAATERVLKKSAIALCRICVDPETCRIMEDHGGVKRALQLCQDPGSRNWSDPVLVACLALLRRISTSLKLNIHPDVLNKSLVNSFRELSTTHESYV